MAEGTNTYEGLGVPLLPADGFEVKQQTASSSTDIMTLTGASGGTGDFVVCQNSSGTEKLSVDSNGNVVAAGFVAVKDNGVSAPTTSDITSNGGLMVANPGTVRLYFRQNGTVYYIDRDG